jgi:uncharacterized protein (DUF2236 family)
MSPDLLETARTRLGSALARRLAGDHARDRRTRTHTTPGPRWFAPDRPIRQVHADAAMFVGGLRALLLQSLHPAAMAGFVEHTTYKDDPIGRMRRTAEYVGVTTYGTAADAEAMIARIKRVHDRVYGTLSDGRPYRADDPHLLAWVHLVETDSFLRAYQRYGAARLDQPGRDGYVDDMATIARALDIPDPPRTEADLAARLAEYRPVLRSTPEAREAARYVLVRLPLPLAARPGYMALSAAAVALMPWWTRWPLRLPYLPLAEATLVRLSGDAATRTIRWLMTPPPQPARVARQRRRSDE